MRSIIVSELGGPEVLKLEERPTPEPGAGQVLVKVSAAGVNFVEIYQRTGLYKVSLPYAIGGEGAGRVVSVGPGVTDVAAGDRVAWQSGAGSYSTHTVLDVSRLAPIPEGVSDEVAAAVMVQGTTAYVLTHDTFPLEPGHTCLVHAAAGGVGLLLCQMARKAGARVIGTTSTEEKAQLARAAGAQDVILYTQVDFMPVVRSLTDGQGVDVVYDSVGKDTFDRSLECLRPRGYLVTFGQSSGAVPPFDILRLGGAKSLYLTRPSVFAYIPDRQALLRYSGALFEMIRAGQLAVRIDRTYPLDHAAEAHRALASRGTSGKVLIVP